MNLIFELQIISVLLCYKEILASNRASTIPPNLSLYKYEGNFYPAYASKNEITKIFQHDGSLRYLNPVQLNHQIYHNSHEEVGDAGRNSDYQEVAIKMQPLQQFSSSGKRFESAASQDKNLKITTISPKEKNVIDYHNENQHRMPNGMNRVTRHYHDIFVKLNTPQELIFGHVLSWPELAEKKIEKRKENNYKGQVIWADKKGGYGEHYWDLAQGAL